MKWSAAAWLLVGLAALLVPICGSPNAIDMDFRICALAMVAISWNLMAGAGLISLGHSAFWGLGGYVAILSANRFGFSLPLALLAAIAAGAAIGAILAVITGRLRGIYFAISTLALSEGLRVLAVMLPDITGGSNGLYLDSKRYVGELAIDLAIALGAIVATVLAWSLTRSRYHFALRAMRDNEAASQMLGIRPARYRIGIVAISGAIASCAGAIGVWHGGYLDPGVAFDLQTTINAQLAPILGGIYTLPGPVVGSIAAIALDQLLRLSLGGVVGASLLAYGFLLVVIILCLPKGICGALQQWVRRPGVRRGAPAVSELPR